MRTAIYVRVSTTYQVDKESLPMQKKDLIYYSENILGIPNYEIFEDAGYSAKNTDRPAFKSMMKRLKEKEFTHVLVWKLDRISRNIADFINMWEEFEALGIRFISKNDNFQTDTPMGRAMLNIIMTFAQLEREMTSMRVKATMISRAKEGKWNGTAVPFGYKYDFEKKYPVIDENEAMTVRYIFDEYEKVRSSIQIAYFLNNSNIRTKRNAKWTSSTILQILKNPMYIGILRYNYRQSGRGKIKPEEEWIVVENNHEPIISKEQFERVRKIIEYNAQTASKPLFTKHDHLLKGLVKCGFCGSMHISSLQATRRTGYTPSYYICRQKKDNKSCIKSGYFSDLFLGEFILNYMKNMLTVQRQKITVEDEMEKILLSGPIFQEVKHIDKSSLIEMKKYFFMDYIPNDISPSKAPEKNTTEQNEVLNQEKNKYETALKKLESLYLFDDTMDEKEFVEKKKAFLEKIRELEEKMGEINVSTDDTEQSEESFINKEAFNKCLIDFILDDEEYIIWKNFAAQVDKKVLIQFIRNTIKQITVGETKQVLEIVFQSGLTQKFIYDQSKNK